MSVDLYKLVRDIPDFPKPGIIFKDITPLLRSPEALAMSIDRLVEPFRGQGVTAVATIESRGFLFGSSVAIALGAGVIPIRKPGKLPWTTRRHEYVLEYGTDALEIHDDALQPEDRVLIIDDVLATGGTLAASAVLVGGFGATIAGLATLIELTFLNGRSKLPDVPFHSILKY